MSYFNEKKGVSQIVAMVLLIAFVVAMGLVVSGWGTKLIKRNIDKGEERIGSDLECMNVKVNIAKIGGKYFVQNNNLKEKKLKGFITKFYEGNLVKVDYKNEYEEVGAFGAKELVPAAAEDKDHVNHRILISNIDKIEVIPQIELDDGGVVDCVKKVAVYRF